MGIQPPDFPPADIKIKSYAVRYGGQFVEIDEHSGPPSSYDFVVKCPDFYTEEQVRKAILRVHDRHVHGSD